MIKQKKKLVEIKGSKLQKTCLMLQLFLLLIMIGCTIYSNINDIESGFITEINNYGVYVALLLLLIPSFFQGNK